MANGEMDGMTNKETFDTLVEIKVSLATLTAQVEQLTDIKQTIETTRQTANAADVRSLENEKDIKQIHLDLKDKATKEEITTVNGKIEEAKQDKQNWWKNAPSWLGVLVSVAAVLIAVLYH